MNVTLIYFSQTGNTLKLSNAMSEAFVEAGHSVKCVNMQMAIIDDHISCDLLGIGSPTFECTAPSPVKDFINSLKIEENQKAFVFATAAGASGNVLFDLAKLLKKKGANVLGGFLCSGDIYHPAPCFEGKLRNRPNNDDLDKAKIFAQLLSGFLFGSNSTHQNHNINFALKRKFGFYNLVGLIGNSDRMIRMLEPKPQCNHNICKQCNLCVRECPVDNISMNSFPVLSDRCIRCYRCINVCPRKAFHVNWWFGNIVLTALYNKSFLRWFGDSQVKPISIS